MKTEFCFWYAVCCSCLGTTAYADDAAAYKLTAVDTARRGDEITVALAVENSPGIAAMTAKVAYNKNVLELAKSENGTAFPDYGQQCDRGWRQIGLGWLAERNDRNTVTGDTYI